MTLEQFNTAKLLMERYEFVQKSVSMLVEIKDSFKKNENNKVVEALTANYIQELSDIQKEFDEL